MTNKQFAYGRVSTKEQNVEIQIKAFKELGIDERDIIIDKASGKNVDDRAGYISLRNNMLRSGDTLIVKSLDRLSRNKADIKAELEYFNANGIRLKVLDLPTTMIDYPEGQEWVLEMVNNILIEVLGTIAEQERATTKQRQSEGYDAMAIVDGRKVSTKTGNAIGRPSATRPDNWNEVIEQWENKQITARKAMELLNLKPNSFYRLLKQA